jgi:hypothetical protein
MSSSRNGRRLLKKEQKKVIPIVSIDDKKICAALVTRMAESGPAILQALIDGGGTVTSSGFAIDGLLNAASHMELAILESDPSKMVVTVAHILFLARHVAILEGKIKVQGEMAKA